TTGRAVCQTEASADVPGRLPDPVAEGRGPVADDPLGYPPRRMPDPHRGLGTVAVVGLAERIDPPLLEQARGLGELPLRTGVVHGVGPTPVAGDDGEDGHVRRAVGD